MADEQLKRNLESVNWLELLQKGNVNKADGILTKIKQSYDKEIEEEEEELQTWENVFVLLHRKQVKILGVYKSHEAAKEALKELNSTDNDFQIQQASMYDF